MSTTQDDLDVGVASGPEVTFDTDDIFPPSQLYVTREDHLFVTSFNGAAGAIVGYAGRIMLPSGEVKAISEVHVPNTNRSIVTTTLPLPEGFLLNLFVFLSAGTVKRGQCYVVVGMGRGTNATPINHQVILQGYVGNNVNLAWPGDRLQQPTEGPGFVYSPVVGNPAAGADIAVVVPAGARWLINQFSGNLHTSAAVANRYSRATGINGGVTVQGGAPLVTAVASNIYKLTWGVGLDTNATGLNSYYSGPLLGRMTFGAGSSSTGRPRQCCPWRNGSSRKEVCVMSTPVGTKVTVTAHQSHWYDIFSRVLAATNAANPILATILPAPVEAGIQVVTSVAPIVAGTVEAVTNPQTQTTAQ